MRDFHSSIDESDLVNSFDLWGESTVDAENLSLNHGTNTEVVEDLRAVFPRISISIFSNGLIIEAVDGRDLSSFMVSSQESDVSWVLKLEAEEELECLHRVEPSVNKVAHENVASVWDLSALIE